MPGAIPFAPKIRICCQSDCDAALHWHESLCILYLLAGKARVTLDGQQYLMHEADVMLVNPYDLYSAELLGSSALLSFSFSPRLVQDALPGLRFRCLSFLAPQKQSACFDRLRAGLATLFQTYLDDPADELMLLSRAYKIFHTLKQHFCCSSDPAGTDSHLCAILSYLNTHYAEKVMLADVAAREYLSANYVSQLFREKLNTTFTQYLTDIRLSHAFLDLCNTDKSITAIALDNGFGRPDTFINRFRRKYAVTPSKYRRGLVRIDTHDPQLIPQDMPHKRYHALLRYLAPQQASLLAPDSVAQHLYLPVSAQTSGTPVRQDWKVMINAGYADDCLTVEVQQQLSDLQQLIHFEYIRFHGIFNDSMHVYFEDEQGDAAFQFSHVDLLLDRLLALGFKPYIELGFLPRLLADGCRPVYQNSCFIGFPSDLSKWCRLVHHFVLHCVERYSLEAVRQWKFTLFSMSFAMYGFLTASEYQQLYESTFLSVKQAAHSLCFGGPGVEGSQLLAPDHTFFQQFLTHCCAHHCVPDFVTMHTYPHELHDMTHGFHQIVHLKDPAACFHLSENRRFMADAIQAMQHCLEHAGLRRLPIIIDEWDATAWQWDIQNDTCYKAAYIVKNLTETMGQTAAKAYWTASDLIGDQKMEPELFHGGHGLYTYNGIRKPALHAFHFLSRMGQQVISSGENWYVTRSAQGIQILLYNDCAYQTEYCLSAKQKSEENRYAPFVDVSPLCFHLSISGLSAEYYTCEYFSIGRDSGNAYDEWVQLGSPADLSPDYLSYLKHRSEPRRRIKQRTSLRDLQLTLDPLEVVQLLITPHTK